MKRHIITIAGALLVVTSACAGPRTPVAIGIKEFPTDVLIGTGENNLKPLERSPITTNPVVAPPRRPRDLASETPSPTPVPDCPAADPLSSPKQEATNRVQAPPVERSYPFRTKGSVNIGGKSSALPQRAVRTVKNVEEVDGSTFTFEVLDELDGVKTLNRYRVVKSGSLDEAVKGETGVFITETVRGDGNDKPVTYKWNPAITLVRFPIEHGDKWDVRSTALDGQVVESFSAHVGDEEPDSPDDVDLDPQIINSKVRVDACGSYLDAWNIQVGVPDATGGPSGHYVGSKCVLDFSEGYAIAPQFGGLVVEDQRSADGTCDNEDISSKRRSTIDEIPALPKS